MLPGIEIKAASLASPSLIHSLVYSSSLTLAVSHSFFLFVYSFILSFPHSFISLIPALIHYSFFVHFPHMPPPSFVDVLEALTTDSAISPSFNQPVPKGTKSISVLAVPTTQGNPIVSLRCVPTPGVPPTHPRIVAHFNNGRERLGADGWFWLPGSSCEFTLRHDPEQPPSDAVFVSLHQVCVPFFPRSAVGWSLLTLCV